jgi:hypothetical protein
MKWTPGNLMAAATGLFLAELSVVILAALLISREVAGLLLLALLSMTVAFGIIAVARWLRAPHQVSPTAAGLFPVLTTNAAGHLVVVNPNAAPGPTASVRADGQVDLGSEFDPGHLLAASRESRVVQATAALSQPDSAVAGGVRAAAAARLLPSAGAADDLPPVRVSTVAPEHVQRLLIEAGELEE